MKFVVVINNRHIKTVTFYTIFFSDIYIYIYMISFCSNKNFVAEVKFKMEIRVDFGTIFIQGNFFYFEICITLIG